MYNHSCTFNNSYHDILLSIYNLQHSINITKDELVRCIESAISLSNADVSFPVFVYWHKDIRAFCIVHLSHQEKIRSLGQLSFSILISNGDSQALDFLFDSIFFEAKKRNFSLQESAVIYGPIHNSILVGRGCRTFAGTPYTYQMPDNIPSLCDWLVEAGCVKKKDLLEIIYEYDSLDTLLTQTDDRLLNRLKNIDFEYVQKKEIFIYKQELAEVYNISWQDNWGASPISTDEIAIAAKNVHNIMGMIARKNGHIVGFTMMQFIVDAAGKVGRAFLSGVLPEYRRCGLSVVLTSKLSSIAIGLGIKIFSISWMLEDNKMIVRTMQKITQHGESQVRHYRVFAVAQKIKGK